jgi:hypothetical protein
MLMTKRKPATVGDCIESLCCRWRLRPRLPWAFSKRQRAYAITAGMRAAATALILSRVRQLARFLAERAAAQRLWKR